MAVMNEISSQSVTSPARLRAFFSPRSIAVLGASEKSSWSRWLFNSLDLPGQGAVRATPVNPNSPTVFGRKAAASLREVEGPIDLAFIMTPAAKAAGMLEDVAAAGIRNAIVLASGFAEAGEEGLAQQVHLGATARRLGITMLGPNTTGFANVAARAVPWAVAVSPPLLAGPVAGVFESGSITRASFEFAQAHAIGASLWVSVGNAACVSTMDIAEYLLEDESTRCIALFLESMKEPTRFKSIAQRALAIGKPIVAMKTGRSAAGSRAGQAHTGALATDDAIVDAAMKQFGVVRVASIEELVVTAGLFGYSKRLPQGRRMGVVTSSGGGCSLIADRAEEYRIDLPAFSEATQLQMKEILPPYATLVNPLDVTGAGNSRARARATKAEDDLLEIAARDGGFDFMFSLMNASFLAARPAKPFAEPSTVAARGAADDQPTPLVPIDSRLAILGKIVADAPAPVFLASSTCLDIAPEQRDMLMRAGIHLLAGVELAMLALKHACWWRQQMAAARAAHEEPARTRTAAALSPQPGLTPPHPGGNWPEDLGRELLERHGVPIVPARLVSSRKTAAAAASEFNVPLAVKICAAEIAHKTDVGGVRLNVPVAGAADAFDNVCQAAAERAKGATVRGVLVSPMRAAGTELLVSITADPLFGNVLTLAIGGTWVEILKDASIRLLPVTHGEVKDMIAQLRGAPLLFGARGSEAADADQLADVVLGIVAAAESLGSSLQALEVNPLRVSGRSVEALDVLVCTQQA